jgi:beta-glucuronidase
MVSEIVLRRQGIETLHSSLLQRQLFCRRGECMKEMRLNRLQFVNSLRVGEHVGGHLPFEFDVTDVVKQGERNRVTVAVNNTLTHNTIPPGDFVYKQKVVAGANQYRDGFFTQTPGFDFFNYAGILRSVYLIYSAHSMIQDIQVETDMDGI